MNIESKEIHSDSQNAVEMTAKETGLQRGPLE